MDCTNEARAFKHSPWIIEDVPGIMGREALEKLAVEEAKKAHGIIFCVDGNHRVPPVQLQRPCLVDVPSVLPWQDGVAAELAQIV